MKAFHESIGFLDGMASDIFASVNSGIKCVSREEGAVVVMDRHRGVGFTAVSAFKSSSKEGSAARLD